MCTEPVQPALKTNPIPKERSSHKTDPGPSFQHDFDDPENALKHLSDPAKPNESASFRNLTFAQVTDQIWHFSSVDHGPRCKLERHLIGLRAKRTATDTCIGYNTLFVIPTLSMPNGKDLPDGKRLWTWLVQCDDGTSRLGQYPMQSLSGSYIGTIISIQENPFARQKGVSIDEAKPVLDVVRRNIRFIFAGVSKLHFAMSESESLITIRVRQFSDLGPDQANIKQEDGPSLLFYYIFDDWVSSYGLIAKREHKYGVLLEELVSIIPPISIIS
jgi:hypothetical protein